jgi:hypothetical protein
MNAKRLSETAGNKRWRIKGWEVEGPTLKDALLAEVRQCECLAWVLIEPDHGEEFEHQRQESLDCDEELDDTDIWTRVYEAEELLWMDALSDINRVNDPDDEELLEIVFLTWDDIEILATVCQSAWCPEMIDVDDPGRCPECLVAFCHVHFDDEECLDCGREWSGVDFLRRAVNT